MGIVHCYYDYTTSCKHLKLPKGCAAMFCEHELSFASAYDNANIRLQLLNCMLL